MIQQSDISILISNRLDLRQEALEIVSSLGTAVAYVWLVWLVWPSAHEHVNAAMWLSWSGLMASLVLCYALKSRALTVASWLLMGGTVYAVTSAVFAFSAPEIVYLFAVPIVLASVLLDERMALVVAAITMCLTIGVVLSVQEASPLLPILVVGLSGSTSWLSIRQLQIALQWSFDGYVRSHKSEESLRDRQAELARTLKSLDTITHKLSRANYMLTLARRDALEGQRQKQQFAQNISHELRTPLNLIVGFAEMIAQSPEHYGEPLPPRYLRDVRVIYKNALHLQKLVNDILDLSRIEAAQMSIQLEHVEPRMLVNETYNTIRSLVEYHNLHFEIQVEPGLPPVLVDATRIRQVLINLISNAVRFTHEGQITLCVFIRENRVVFAVKDTGIGIPEADVPHIFDAFYQVDGSLNRKSGGAGLGLAISQEFVKLHRGHMWVESCVGKGSTFFFSLPPADGDITTQISGLAVLQAVDQERIGRLRTALVVTETPPAASLFSRYLEDCRVHVVSNLDQAAGAAARLYPQVVILDEQLHAPQPDILSLMKHPALTDSVFITCQMPGHNQLRWKLPIDDFLVKPISRERLWDALRLLGEDLQRILIIDDDQDFVRLISMMLDHPLRPYQVASAYNGYRGLEMYRHFKPDIVLLDLKMPDIHGTDVLEQICAQSNGTPPRVIVVSAEDDPETLQYIPGSLTLTRSQGLKPGEIIRWLQCIIDSVARTESRPVPSPGSAQ